MVKRKVYFREEHLDEFGQFCYGGVVVVFVENNVLESAISENVELEHGHVLQILFKIRSVYIYIACVHKQISSV